MAVWGPTPGLIRTLRGQRPPVPVWQLARSCWMSTQSKDRTARYTHNVLTGSLFAGSGHLPARSPHWHAWFLAALRGMRLRRTRFGCNPITYPADPLSMSILGVLLERLPMDCVHVTSANVFDRPTTRLASAPDSPESRRRHLVPQASARPRLWNCGVSNHVVLSHRRHVLSRFAFRDVARHEVGALSA